MLKFKLDIPEKQPRGTNDTYFAKYIDDSYKGAELIVLFFKAIQNKNCGICVQDLISPARQGTFADNWDHNKDNWELLPQGTKITFEI